MRAGILTKFFLISILIAISFGNYFYREAGIAYAQNTNGNYWDYRCIDTMKYSRDRAREYVNKPDVKQFISNEIALIQNAGANCVSIDTPYDEEFVKYLGMWTDEAHSRGLIVWFRGNMSGWEGWFNYPKLKTTQQHDEGINHLILKHPTLFKAGDVFTPAPEPENGILGDPRNSPENKEAFVKFLPESYNNCVESFEEIKVDVTCGFFSFNGDVARQIMTKDLLSSIGNVLVVDHYVSSPEKLVSDLKGMREQFGVPVILGEFGAPVPGINPNFNEDQQNQFISDSLKYLSQENDLLSGINYWVLRGGSTALINDNGTERKVYTTVKNYYSPFQINGMVTDTLGNTVSNVVVSASGDADLKTQTDSKGEYILTVPSGSKVTVAVDDSEWISESNVSTTLDQYTPDFNLEVRPAHTSFWYRILEWFKSWK
jgi:hypothetical protein